MNKIRLGIIGTGGISNSHVKAYKQMDDVEIVAGGRHHPRQGQRGPGPLGASRCQSV